MAKMARRFIFLRIVIASAMAKEMMVLCVIRSYPATGQDAIFSESSRDVEAAVSTCNLLAVSSKPIGAVSVIHSKITSPPLNICEAGEMVRR